jgi:dUTP pyrophosphatase
VVKVEIQLLHKDAKMPTFAYEGDAGADLYALHDVVIKKSDRALVKTGIAIALPQGFEAQIRPRSGLALKHGITVLNTPGTIDAGYRGEVGVILANMSHDDYLVEKHTKIAQMLVKKVNDITFKKVDKLSSSQRGKGGFGSSGK